MPELTDYLNSDYLEAANSLQPKSVPNQVTVYVESDEDIAFWFNILSPYQSPTIQFNIILPSHEHLEKGKVAALKKSNNIFTLISEEQLGNFLLIAVDSDYDYLLHREYKNAEKQDVATKINENSHILQTYTYSIENYKCYADSLHEVCVSSTLNNKRVIDFDTLLKRYSSIVYDLLIWNLFFYAEDREEEFTLNDFTKYVKLSQMPNLNKLNEALVDMQNAVVKKIGQLETDYPELIADVLELKNNFVTKGLSQETAYLFVQGHTLYDNFVSMILHRICEGLKTESISKIKIQGTGPTQIRDEINSYKKRTLKISDTLARNTNFKDCFLFQEIKTDINNYMSGLNPV